MQSFIVDGRNGQTNNPCGDCCCLPASGVPGETNQFEINYTPWSMPIGGRGLCQMTEVAIEVQKDESENNPSNTHYGFSTEASTQLAGDVSTNAAPTTDTFTYALHPLCRNKSGTLVFNADGTFTFDANGVVLGEQTFWYVMTDSSGNTATRQVSVNVVANGQPTVVITPNPQKVEIVQNRFNYNIPMHTIRFPVTINLNATPGEIHRVTLKQDVLDCDGNTFTHIQCIDIVIGKCR